MSTALPPRGLGGRWIDDGEPNKKRVSGWDRNKQLITDLRAELKAAQDSLDSAYGIIGRAVHALADTDWDPTQPDEDGNERTLAQCVEGMVLDRQAAWREAQEVRAELVETGKLLDAARTARDQHYTAAEALRGDLELAGEEMAGLTLSLDALRTTLDAARRAQRWLIATVIVAGGAWAWHIVAGGAWAWHLVMWHWIGGGR